MPGPGRYRLLKQYARKQLTDGFSVPDDHVHEEFPIGGVIHDVVAYPPVDRKEEAAIGVECGDRSTSLTETCRDFAETLDHVDILLWFPYSHDGTFEEVTAHCGENLSVVVGRFPVGSTRFTPVVNSPTGDCIWGAILSRAGRFSWLDEHLDATVTPREGLVEG